MLMLFGVEGSFDTREGREASSDFWRAPFFLAVTYSITIKLRNDSREFYQTPE